MKRMLFSVTAVVGILALAMPPAAAQSDYPSRTVRLVHGFTAGGISDVLARSIGARLTTSLGQQVHVQSEMTKLGKLVQLSGARVD